VFDVVTWVVAALLLFPHVLVDTWQDPKAAAAAISALEGVVDHGLFLDMVDVCIIAAAGGVEVREK